MLTPAQLEELKALRETNDATGRPTFLLRRHWLDSGYAGLVRRGLVTWGPPPAGFGKARFAGATITDAGRAALSTAESKK